MLSVPLGSTPRGEASPRPSRRQQENTVHIQPQPNDDWYKQKDLAKQGGLQHSHSLLAVDWVLAPSGIFSFAYVSKKMKMSGPGTPAGNRRNNANASRK